MSEAVELYAFLERLREASIHFELSSVRPRTVMVAVAVPGERWEIEFFENGEVEVEVFASTGVITGSGRLAELLARHSD